MSEAESLFKPRLMLVDDEECIRETVCALLAMENIAIVTAVDGFDCLRQLRRGFRGVILMDVMMPDMDGWTTIREIQGEGLMAGNIISMLTALDVPDARMEGLQEYVIDYMTKPFEPSVFVATVRKYIALLDLSTGGN